MSKIKYILVILFALLFVSNIFADNTYIKLHAERYDYNLNSKKLQKVDYQSIVKSISKNKAYVGLQILQFPKETVVKYSSEIRKNDFGLGKYSLSGEETNLFSYDNRYDMLIVPQFNEKGEFINKSKLFISSQKRLPAEKDDLFELSQFRIMDEDLRTMPEFCMSESGKSINSMIQNDDLNLIIAENEGVISILSLKITVKNDNQETQLGQKYQLKKHLDNDVIEIPFFYNINYKNSSGMNEVLGRISQDCLFQIPIYKEKIYDNAIKSNIEKKYMLNGELFPIKYENQIISLKGLFSFIIEYYDNDGILKNTERSNIFQKKIDINESDAIQIKFTKNCLKDLKLEQSLTIKPIPNLSSSKDYFKPTKVIKISDDDNI